MTQTVAALYDTYDSAVAAVKALEAAGVSGRSWPRAGWWLRPPVRRQGR